MNLAPIVLFAYNRPKHLKQTIKALIANYQAKHSELFIYIDGAKDNLTKIQLEDIQEVRDYLALLHSANRTEHFFQSIHITQREYNFGLADSIIQGVSEIIGKYGKAIILEDDILTSPVFLDYMNAALEKYKNEPKVWNICAWSYPINPQNLGDCYFWRSPHCWGWASWADRWQHFKRDTQWALENFSQEDIEYINIDGTAHYFEQLLANHRGEIKTWAIFYYLLAYKHNALSLCPDVSYIKQIGFDGSGVHCTQEGEILNTQNINTRFPIAFPEQIIESHLAFERIKDFELSLKKSLPLRVKSKITKSIVVARQKLGNAIGGGV